MARRRKGRRINGWIVLDKPAGLSSAGAVGKVRAILGAAKAGHGGTLDPLATGVLPIALGEATKTVPYVMDGRKAYRFRIRWGEARDTLDGEGAVVGTSDVRPDRAALEAALPRFVGRLKQVPPKFSALKVAGARAYELARAGQPVTLTAREVEVFSLTLVAATREHADFDLACGKGTYVRALARDLAEAVGALGYVEQLRRTRAGPFTESDAISLDKLAELVHSAPLESCLLPLETALDDIPALAISGEQANRLRAGQSIVVDKTGSGVVCAMSGGRPVALARLEAGELKPVRVFNQTQAGP
jgi:tRNA pseudouridine55 synthase